MKRLTVCCLMLALLAGSVRLTAADAAEDKEASREALKALQEFIGDWKGIGGPDKVKPDVRDKAWQENSPGAGASRATTPG